jgi:hypothetical protein
MNEETTLLDWLTDNGYTLIWNGIPQTREEYLERAWEKKSKYMELFL